MIIYLCCSSDQTSDAEAVLFHAFYGDIVATNFRNDISQDWLSFLGSHESEWRLHELSLLFLF